MGSLLALVFIGGVAASGIYVATRPTIADGRVIEDTLHEAKPTITFRCDDKIPIGVEGAVFRCDVSADDGSSGKVEYTIDRAGQFSGKILDSADPTEDEPRPTRRDAGDHGDPWQ